MEIDTEHLHHAYLFEGSIVEGKKHLDRLLLRLNIEKEQNPDYQVFENEAFTVDEARVLNERAQNKSFGAKKIFIISTNRYTPEAQNALLKTIEEPTTNTHFFLLLPDRNLLLPTLLSRLYIIRLNNSYENLKQEAEDFISLTPVQRIKLTKKFVDNELSLSQFLDSMLNILRKKGASLEQIELVSSMRQFSDDPSVMPRLVLEHLAVTLKFMVK